MKILIAEDDENSRILLESILTCHGHEVISAANGMQAAQILCENLAELVISDILMPELDGFGLLRFVRSTESLRKLPFIVYSATYVDSKDEELALSLGADRFITKPYDIGDLIAVINDMSVPTATCGMAVPRASRLTAPAISAQHLARVQSKLEKKVRELEEEREALQNSERRFRDFAESAGDFFWETDSDMCLQFATGAGTGMLGLSIIGLLRSTKQTKEDSDADGQTDTQPHFGAFETQQRFQGVLLEWRGEESCDAGLFRFSGKPYYNAQGLFSGYRGVAQDVTRSVKLERELRYLATHDPLTGLMNRVTFESRLQSALEIARQQGTQHAICYIDLDQFKVVNDTAGHAAGDDLLKCIADVIRRTVRHHDTVARFGGDEFALLLEDCPVDKAISIAWNVTTAVSAFRFRRGDRVFETGASIGVVAVSGAAESVTDLLTQADVACYTAKEHGRRRVHLYDGEAIRHKHLEIYRAAEIGDLLRSDRFCLFAQPIVEITAKRNSCSHFEVLLRLVDEDGSIVPPGVCISAAERYGTITSIDRWVIAQTLSKVAIGNANRHFTLNLSGHSVSDPSLPEYIRRQLDATRVAPERICFELTETAAFTNPLQAAAFVDEMSALGCKLALDDFGTGVSSLTYLKNLRVDFLKIDGSFVRDMVIDPIDEAMVSTIHRLGKVMNLKTVAESVENMDILSRLRDLEIDYGQGYALGMPASIDERL